MLRHRILLTLGLLALSLPLAGCDTFEEWFSTKKPLPGDRRAVFPEGVPGVPNGVPPELVKGYQPPAEPPPVVAEQVPEKPKPKPKPKPRKVAAPAAPASGGVSIRPAGQSDAPAQPAASPFPPPSGAPQGQPMGSPFPDPPKPGTFTR